MVANDSHLGHYLSMNSPMRSYSSAAAKLGPVRPAAPLSPSRPLDRLEPNVPAVVCGIDPLAAGQPPDRERQLQDIGFVPGERVTVLTRAWPGNDPLVVLVGHSRFALRSAEAACIQVLEIA
jgi:ferrous iron transport protein A